MVDTLVSGTNDRRVVQVRVLSWVRKKANLMEVRLLCCRYCVILNLFSLPFELADWLFGFLWSLPFPISFLQEPFRLWL